MPQEQHVVRCFACKKFQVQIVKKVPKWQCKVCSEKQSLLKVYAQGSGKECRQHVQNLNMQQGLLSQEAPNYGSSSHFEDQQFNNAVAENLVVNNKTSKWSEYLDDDGASHIVKNSWEEETSNKHTESSMSRGRKRKLTNQDDFEDYSTFQQSYQAEGEVLDLSSGPCASDILKNCPVNQDTQHTVSPHSVFSNFTSSRSKWSQFVSPNEKILSSPGNQNPGAPWNNSKDKFTPTTSIPLSNSNSHNVATFTYMKQNEIVNQSNECSSFGNSRGEGKLTSSTTVKNPFCTTDEDDNLDTLLDF